MNLKEYPEFLIMENSDKRLVILKIDTISSIYESKDDIVISTTERSVYGNNSLWYVPKELKEEIIKQLNIRS